MKTLGLIPARSGSKSVPNKNIVMLCGRPLIAYTLEAAARASHLDRCIVSTDAEEIAAVCRAHGGEVPFLRPKELAADDTPTLPVVLHALETLGESYDAVMVLQPTSPLRTSQDIDAAISLLDANPVADSVISVVKVGDHHPARMKYLEDGYLVDPSFAEAHEGQRRQDLLPLYLRNGAIYLTRTRVLLDQKTFKGRRSLAYVMPEERSVNIDGPFDLWVAEAALTHLGTTHEKQ